MQGRVLELGCGCTRLMRSLHERFETRRKRPTSDLGKMLNCASILSVRAIAY